VSLVNLSRMVRGKAMGSATSCDATVSASVTACPAPMASSNTCADADDAGLPEAVGDASLFRSIQATKPIDAQKRL
jgi:hypothetical protein